MKIESISKGPARLRTCSFWLTSISLGVLTLTLQSADAGPKEQAMATRLFGRLASSPLSLTDPRRAQMETLILQGNILGAAQVATQDDNFYNTTLRNWATVMASREEDPQIAQANERNFLGKHYLNDFAAMVIGSVRDGYSAQELLNGNFNYHVQEAITGVTPYQPVDNDVIPHYTSLDKVGVNLRQKLVRVTPQRPDMTDAAGLITSQAWGNAHFKAGSNRRPLHFAFRSFLCYDIDQMRDTVYPLDRIRRDVDRAPGGDATVFTSTCKTCHGAMDAMAGAFAHLDFVNIPENTVGMPLGYQLVRYPNALNAFVPGSSTSTVVRKMNQGSFSSTYVTTDDSWINYFIQSQSSVNRAIGWPTNMTSGRGVKSLGTMLANTKAFPVCMTKRVFTEICAREPLPVESGEIQRLADDFVAGGYKLKSLFEKTAILPSCLGN